MALLGKMRKSSLIVAEKTLKSKLVGAYVTTLWTSGSFWQLAGSTTVCRREKSDRHESTNKTIRKQPRPGLVSRVRRMSRIRALGLGLGLGLHVVYLSVGLFHF